MISCCREISQYSETYDALVAISAKARIRLPSEFPSSVKDLTKLMHSALLDSIQENYERFEEDERERSKHVLRTSLPVDLSHVPSAEMLSHTHALYDSGHREADERLYPACKHLFTANNLCPLYLYLKNDNSPLHVDESQQKPGQTRNLYLTEQRDSLREHQKVSNYRTISI